MFSESVAASSLYLRQSSIACIGIENSKKASLSPTVSQGFLKEIMASTGWHMNRISLESKIPLSTLYRLQSAKTKEPYRTIFQKLLGLYCRVVSHK